MLFSYGFLEHNRESANELFLELDIPDDDPLKLPKKAIANTAPGVKLVEVANGINWESDFVWMLCVNEEDGLDFQLLQGNDGSRELQATWREDIIKNAAQLKNRIQGHARWEIFQLRAVVTLQNKIEEHLATLQRSSQEVNDAEFNRQVNPQSRADIMRLRAFETRLLLKAYDSFEEKVCSNTKS